MKLKKEHIACINETAMVDFDSAMQMVDGVNMLSEVEYGFNNNNTTNIFKWRVKQ